MNIEDQTNEMVMFESLKGGDVFYYNNELLIKFYDRDSGFNPADGRVYSFISDLEVRKCKNAKIVVGE